MSAPVHGSREWFVGELLAELQKHGISAEVAQKTVEQPDLQPDIDEAHRWDTLAAFGVVAGRALRIARTLTRVREEQAQWERLHPGGRMCGAEYCRCSS